MNQPTQFVDEAGCLRPVAFGCLFGIVGGFLGSIYGVRDYNAQVSAFLADHPNATIDWLPVGPVFWAVIGLLVASLVGVAVGAALPRKRHAA
jgi:hypothetical protein